MFAEMVARTDTIKIMLSEKQLGLIFAGCMVLVLVVVTFAIWAPREAPQRLSIDELPLSTQRIGTSVEACTEAGGEVRYELTQECSYAPYENDCAFGSCIFMWRSMISSCRDAKVSQCYCSDDTQCPDHTACHDSSSKRKGLCY